MAHGHRQVCINRGGCDVLDFRPGQCAVADIYFGSADHGGMSGRWFNF